MAITHDDYDLIVIGSGIGGLTVASLMAQMRKKRVLVLERHFKLGGFTHEFSRPGGYSWDVGLHYVGGMARGEMSRNLMDLVTGGAVQWNKMQSPFERFVYPDFTFDVPADEAAYQQALIERFPDERAAIVQYFKDLESGAKWFSHHLVKQCAPFMISAPLRIGAASDTLALSTTGAYLDRNFRDPKLKAVLASQWGDYGLPPSQSAFAIHATVVSSYFNGGYYPEGGAGTIAASVARIVEANGGKCLVNHTVREIIVESGVAVGVKVTVSHGSRAPEEMEFRAPLIVSDAGALDHVLTARAARGEHPLPRRAGSAACGRQRRHPVSRTEGQPVRSWDSTARTTGSTAPTITTIFTASVATSCAAVPASATCRSRH